MKKCSILFVLLCCFCLRMLAQTQSAAVYTSFDVPGAYPAGMPQAVNKYGAVTGYYSTVTSVPMGFLYQPSGTVTTFFVKIKNVSGTFPTSINDSGWIAGYYWGGTVPGYHGFLRSPQITTLDVPGAGTGQTQGTKALSINNTGQIAGVYIDAQSVQHGFVRDASGNYTTIDVPGGVSVTNVFINQSGVIAGTYLAAGAGEDLQTGFVRDTFGNIATFSAPPSVELFVTGINSIGQIAGYSYPTGDPEPFMRDEFGDITTFNVLGWDMSAGIEDNGNSVGSVRVGTTTQRGWQATSTGAVSFFKEPNAGVWGTVPTCVSGNGKVAGYYTDSQGIEHNFVMHP
jgi:hypothetical protein